MNVAAGKLRRQGAPEAVRCQGPCHDALSDSKRGRRSLTWLIPEIVQQFLTVVPRKNYLESLNKMTHGPCLRSIESGCFRGGGESPGTTHD